MSNDTSSIDPKLRARFESTTTPYDQVKMSNFVDSPGQYDWVVKALNPITAPNGMYACEAEVEATAPAEAAGATFRRTLYIGTGKDLMADLPDTVLNSSTIRFLKGIAKVNNIPVVAQNDKKFWGALIGKSFGCALVKGKPYIGRDGNQRTGLEFGRNVTAKGALKARLFTDETTPTPAVANGQAGPVTTASTVPPGAFASE